MHIIRHKNDRGLTETDWLTSRHSFSFGHYHDPAQMGFGVLRVINEDWVAPGTGFDTHGHKNMEIITYILHGALAHKDNLGTGSTIHPNEVQVMSAGSGILHSEHNAAADTTHLLQIWITPQERNTEPGYQQTAFPAEEMRNSFRLLVSPDGRDGSLAIRQNALLYATRLEARTEAAFPLEKKRAYWLQVARGTVELLGAVLEAGDGMAIEDEDTLARLHARDAAEVLLFDLPPRK